ncbi:MAG: chromate transporter [Oscillospiraceae bacterium]
MLLNLFWTFLKIGGLTFGGGYAMLPMLQREVVDSKGWATTDELMDYYAIGQCTPGIIAVNSATFVGYKQRGILGGICATLGVVFPSLVIISVIAAVLQNFADIPEVGYAFAGIRVCVCVLIFNAVIKLSQKSLIDVPTICVFAAVFALSAFTTVSPVVLVLCSGLCGVVIQTLRQRSEGGAK